MSNKPNYSFSAVIAAGLLFLLTRPYFVWGLFRNNYIWGGTIIICFLLFVANISLKKPNTIGMLFLWVGVLLSLCLCAGVSFMGAIPFICLTVFPFAKSRFFHETFEVFLNITSILLTLSLLSYLVVAAGLPLPSRMIAPLNELKSMQMQAYPLFVKPVAGYVGIDRFHAFWDEPGAVGTYVILLLGVQRFRLNDWRSVVLLISGVLSLSFFFFACVFVSYFYRIFFVGTNRVTFAKIATMFVLVVLLGYLMTEGTFLYDAVGWRFKYDADSGTVAGDNRASEFQKEYVKSISWTSREYYFGTKDKYVWDQIQGTSSYLNSVMRYGFVGFSLYVLFFMMYAWRNVPNRREFILFLLIFAFNHYQRPDVGSVPYVFLYLAWCRLVLKQPLIKQKHDRGVPIDNRQSAYVQLGQVFNRSIR